MTQEIFKIMASKVFPHATRVWHGINTPVHRVGKKHTPIKDFMENVLGIIFMSLSQTT